MESNYKKIEASLEMLKSLLMTNKKMLTLDEACHYTGYEKSYMYKLTSDKLIPHSKPNHKIFFDKDELDNWLSQNKVQDIKSRVRSLVGNNY